MADPRRRFRPVLLKLEDRYVPSGVPLDWSQRGSGGGGSLFSPSFNPANGNEIYVSSDMSQLFRTTDAGATWQTTDFRELSGNHESKVQFTDNPNIRYTLDYTNIAGADLVRPTKSTDGGANWAPIASDPTGGEAYYIFADPNDANRLAVTDYTRLYLSTNGGTTWNLRYNAGSGNSLMVSGAFWDGSNIFFGTNQGLLVSTNGGTSFAVEAHGGIPAGQVLLGFAAAKVGGVTRFLGVTWNTGDVYPGVAGYENKGGQALYTMDYTTPASWSPRTFPAGAWPFYAGMAANNINVMYAAGGASDGEPTVLKSINGGATWSHAFLTNGNNQNIQTGWSGDGGDRGWGYGELAMGFAVATNDANKLIITDFGFAHSSSDGGANWKALYVNPLDLNPANADILQGDNYRSSGLDNTTSWGVTWANGGNMFISNSDVRGQLSKDSGQTWGFGYTGHTNNSMYRVVKTPNGNLYGAAGSVHDMYQSTRLQDNILDAGTGALLMSANNGVTWSVVRNFGRTVVWVAVDPNNPNWAFASVIHSTQGGIWKTENLSAGAGSTWQQLTNPPRTEGHPFNIVILNDGSIVASYSGRRNPAGTFTNSSGVFHSTDNGQTWIDRSAPGMIYWTKDVIVDPHDPSQNTWYAGVFSGWGGPPNGLGGLYKSTNRGVSWTRILNRDRVASATFNPADQNELFVTTEVEGLWYSNNIRAATPTFTQVASYPFRQPERVFFNPANANEIWVTSFGGGVRVGVNNPPAPTTQINGGAAQRSRITTIAVTFPSPVNVSTLGTISLTRTAGPNIGTQVQTGATGANGRILVSPASGTVSTITLTFDNANGAATSSVQYGSLADGRWQLAIPNQSYTSTINDLNLRRLFGDANADGTVDGGDLAQLGSAFGTNNNTFDFDANGIVDAADFAEFGNRFGLSM